MAVSFSGLTPNAFPVNTRAVRDVNYLTANVALPATATTANTGNLNLLVATPFPTTETINVHAVIGAVASGTANNKNCTAYLQHTEANSDGTANSANWTNIPTLGTFAAQDNNGGGWAQTEANYKLPPGCKQFIRAQCVTEANGGNAATGNIYIELLF